MLTITELKSRELSDPDYFSLSHLRYEVLIKEQNKKIKHADCINQIIVDELDNSSIIYIAKNEEKVIGMLRCNTLNQTNYTLLKDDYALDTLNEDIPMLKSFITTRYIVHPAYRNKRVAFDLVVQASEGTFNNLGMRYSIVGSTDAIFKFHTRLGYRRYTKEPILFKEGMYVYPMILDLANKVYLKQIKSPLYHIIHGVTDEASIAYT